MTEKVFEFIVRDDAVLLVLRPPLAFEPEDARISVRDAAPCLQVISGRHRVSFELPEDMRDALMEGFTLQILEYEIRGELTVRETELPVSPPCPAF